jgi:hypothetical protein
MITAPPSPQPSPAPAGRGRYFPSPRLRGEGYDSMDAGGTTPWMAEVESCRRPTGMWGGRAMQEQLPGARTESNAWTTAWMQEVGRRREQPPSSCRG